MTVEELIAELEKKPKDALVLAREPSKVGNYVYKEAAVSGVSNDTPDLVIISTKNNAPEVALDLLIGGWRPKEHHGR